ncbi:MAG: glycosyltransferase involved in cell wall biosynthesis [Francisellaceae bacterium]|jgi:glycosyltransferase involved in cell wall biosynthesis
MKNFISKINGVKSYTIIFDHELDGGTKLFRQRKVQDLLSNDAAVLLILSNDRISNESVILQLVQNKVAPESHITNTRELFIFLNSINPQNIEINSLVTYRPFMLFLSNLHTYLKNIGPKKLNIAFHDYYPICPSFNLLNSKWQYCHVPENSVCRQCRPKHFSGMLKDKNIENWRPLWQSILNLSTDITVFSNSSLTIVKKAFHDVDAKLRLVPHSMKYFTHQEIIIAPSLKLNIGVIGHITKAKGADVLKQLGEYISENKINADIIVFGQLKEQNRTSNTIVLGPYELNQLANNIQSNNVNVMFMPSICPETFSYATEELMALALPIVSFNLGAQGEKISNYKNGTTISTKSSSEEILSVLKVSSICRANS